MIYQALHQKKKFSVKDFFSKCKQTRNRKLYFLYSERNLRWLKSAKIYINS